MQRIRYFGYGKYLFFANKEICIMQIINQIIQKKQMEILQLHKKLYLVKRKIYGNLNALIPTIIEL